MEAERPYVTDHPLADVSMVVRRLYPLRLTISRVWSQSKINPPWDRDLLLKNALGLQPTALRKIVGI